MKRYLLDTNVVSELRKRKPHGAVLAWMATLKDNQFSVCAFTIGELQGGVEKIRHQDPHKAMELDLWIDGICQTAQVISMDANCFREWARLMDRKPHQIAQDGLTAATARVHGLIVATRNEADFHHFDVEIFNPFHYPR